MRKDSAGWCYTGEGATWGYSGDNATWTLKSEEGITWSCSNVSY